MTTLTTQQALSGIEDAAAALLEAGVPRATYRLQFNASFTFGMAERLVPYLAGLGISHLYASPLFRATPGSMHGYDVVDFGQLNPEIGTDEQFRSLVASLHRHGMRLILDVVPNHMGIEGGRNAWWQDVLEHGQLSPYADYFDIEWDPIKAELRGKVLLPFLGDQYGTILERGELRLGFAEGAFTVHYWETPFPLSPITYPRILRLVEARLEGVFDGDDLDILELQSISSAVDGVDRQATIEVGDDADVRTIHRREQFLAKHRLQQLVDRSPAIAAAVQATVTELNGDPARPESLDALDQLLDAQPYRLSSWRVAAEEINYRRFFAINTLAAIRQEERAVFDDTHSFLVALIAEGLVDGVRIDHPDGLWDPAAYFRDLQRAVLVERARRALDVPADDDDSLNRLSRAADTCLDQRVASGQGAPLYIVAEKILEHGESLRDDWMIAGTVGYEYATATTGVFVNPDSRIPFDRIYTRFTDDRVRYPELVYGMKQRMMREAFASEVNVLSRVLNRMSEHDRHSRDFTLNSIRDTLREILASFSVYRTYIACGRETSDVLDRRFVQHAVSQAMRMNPTLDESVFEFISDVLIGEEGTAFEERNNCHFAMKLQQLSGPVMAKGVEDTAFYRFNRLMSLNEVGGQPSRFGTPVAEFHRQNRARLRRWPTAMITSSTHDTKRSEDVRARISVLSEIPNEWRAALNRWSKLNRKLKRKIDGALAPQRIDEYVLYQTLAGTWPLVPDQSVNGETYVDRIVEYMIKVGREANRLTNWVNPDEDYEAALTTFIKGLFDRRRSRIFLEDMDGFAARVRTGGMVNGLAQQVLKLTSPGVPDIYQGTELWDDSLVDPDNRRPVDFGVRQALAASGKSVAEAWADPADGWIKLLVTQRILEVRAHHSSLFAEGDYLPLEVEGPAREHVIAFARQHEAIALLVVVPRLSVMLAGSSPEPADGTLWQGTSIILPPVVAGAQLTSIWADRAPVTIVTDRDRMTVDVSELFADVPCAVLITST